MTNTRSPDMDALYGRFEAGEISRAELTAAWGPLWDAWRLAQQQAETVATAVLFLQVQS